MRGSQHEEREMVDKVKGPVTLQNRRTGEVWLCEDYSQRRVVDGVEFIEVHQPSNGRKVWISAGALVKAKAGGKEFVQNR